MPKRLVLSDSEDEVIELPSRSQSTQSSSKGRLKRRSQRDSGEASDSDVLEEEDIGVQSSQLNVNRTGYILDSDEDDDEDDAKDMPISIENKKAIEIVVSTPMGVDLPLKSTLNDFLVDMLKSDDVDKLRAYIKMSLDKYTPDRDGDGRKEKKRKKRKREDHGVVTSFLDLLLRGSVLNSTGCIEYLLNFPTRKKEMIDFMTSERNGVTEVKRGMMFAQKMVTNLFNRVWHGGNCKAYAAS